MGHHHETAAYECAADNADLHAQRQRDHARDHRRKAAEDPRAAGFHRAAAKAAEATADRHQAAAERHRARAAEAASREKKSDGGLTATPEKAPRFRATPHRGRRTQHRRAPLPGWSIPPIPVYGSGKSERQTDSNARPGMIRSALGAAAIFTILIALLIAAPV